MVSMRMPFGKHEGKLLIALNEEYLSWFGRKGWPNGKLGQMMQIIHETRINGDTDIFWDLRKDCIKRGLIVGDKPRNTQR